MKPEQFEAIRKRTNAVGYHGNMWANFNDATYACGKTVYEFDELTESNVDILVDCKTEEIAEFIAHAREDIPTLLAEVERLRNGIATAIKETNCDDTWDYLNRLHDGKEASNLSYRIGGDA